MMAGISRATQLEKDDFGRGPTPTVSFEIKTKQRWEELESLYYENIVQKSLAKLQENQQLAGKNLAAEPEEKKEPQSRGWKALQRKVKEDAQKKVILLIHIFQIVDQR
jgi:hypothetical protein